MNSENYRGDLTGRFYGKTGTLTGIRTLSGIMKGYNGVKFVSIFRV